MFRLNSPLWFQELRCFVACIAHLNSVANVRRKVCPLSRALRIWIFELIWVFISLHLNLFTCGSDCVLCCRAEMTWVWKYCSMPCRRLVLGEVVNWGPLNRQLVEHQGCRAAMIKRKALRSYHKIIGPCTKNLSGKCIAQYLCVDLWKLCVFGKE